MSNDAIRIIDPDRGEQAWAVPFMLSGTELLVEAEIVWTGIDCRPANIEWGEGVSLTHLLFWVTAGRMFNVGGRGREITVGELLIVPGGCAKRLRTEKVGVEGIWAHLSPSPRWQVLEGNDVTIRGAQRSDAVKHVMYALRAEAFATDAQSERARHALSRLLLDYLEAETRSPGDPVRQEQQLRLQRLWSRVNMALAEDWPVDRLAKEMNMSSRQFHRLFESLHGCGPNAFVKRLRLEHAASLLRSSGAKLDAIAAEVGYASAYSFSKAFFDHFGVRPGRYRQGLP